MKEQLQAIEAQAIQALQAADSLAALDELRVAYLGKKGELTAILKQMGKLTPEERPVIGQLANQVRANSETKLDECLTEV
ncbi:MAG: phenylalanine--tRNA ligase subunit alpha, partial [Clostridia bacterium]|nr:phenylalanine--tRNA ligase subunit alpha [Clostridia bacterium]